MKAYVYHSATAAEVDVNAQVETLWNRATELGYTVEKVYCDRCPAGADPDRPGLEEMMRDARGGSVKMLLACDPHCIASEPEEYDRIRKQLEEFDVQIHFIDLAEPKSQLYC